MSAGEHGTDPASHGPPSAAMLVAAGGVVLDGDGPDARVLVVHRPAYDDWSLPKGHVDPDEPLVDTARREVVEETGVAAHVTADAGTTSHALLRDGVPAHKQVHWFVMRPEADAADPAARAPDDEVDRAAWWPVTDALRDLTHAGERTLLARVLGVA